MCGIFGFINNNPIDKNLFKTLSIEGEKCKKRGPDNTIINNSYENIFLMFHRLKINDTSDEANQPMMHPSDEKILLMCNGEIYNCKILKKKYNITTKTNSDCEIILHLYKKFGIKKTVSELDGVFAIILLDKNKNVLYVARDPIGVRSLYYGYNKSSIGFASEAKCLALVCDIVKPFRTGSYIEINLNLNNIDYSSIINHKFYEFKYKIKSCDNIHVIKNNIKTKLTYAVEKRLLSDRPIGCLLSGGLDSTLITGLVKNFMKNNILRTFSIGLEGAEDLKFAREAAEYIGTDHTDVIVSPDEMFDAIPNVIREIESYDVTTVRASTPMYLLCKYIKQHTDITVIFSGEGSDEASGSYLYFHNAPNENEFQKEIVRLMKDLQYFDVLRCDKTSAANSLEVRVPFLDKNFIDYYMSIDPKYKIPKKNKIEKYLLRDSFDSENLIPKSILWRKKEAMSDGVSSLKKPWFEIIQDKIENIISDEELDKCSEIYSHNTPKTKEALYYRNLYSRELKNHDKNIPYLWLPKWSNENLDPSARKLNVYNHSST